MLLFTDFGCNILAIIIRNFLTSFPRNLNTFLLGNLLAVLVRLLVALGVLLLDDPHLGDWSTFGLRQILARVRDIGPDFVVVALR